MDLIPLIGHAPSMLLLGVVAFVVMLVIYVVLGRRRDRGRIATMAELYTSSRPATSFSHVPYLATPFNRSDLSVAGQNSDWGESLQRVGSALSSRGIQAVAFVHGTFVGSDPLGVSEMLLRWRGPGGRYGSKVVQQLIKRHQDRMTGDSGNFLPSYVELFQTATGRRFPCHNFVWESANHNAARLRAAVRLGANLVDQFQNARLGHGDFLLISHSHGGQVIALLSHLIYRTAAGRRILDILQASAGFDRQEIATNLKIIRRFRMRVVTLGMPPRLTWPAALKHRLIHIINHHGDDHLGSSWRSVLHPRGVGDLVQQLGIAGSDALAASAADRALNGNLEPFLGVGCDPDLWMRNARLRMRVPSCGRTIFVSYPNPSPNLPAWIGTVFGHGVYTRFENMRFNCELIARSL